MTPDQLDHHLDQILRASGSALANYTLQKTRDDMREALRVAVKEAWIAGSDAGWKAARGET